MNALDRIRESLIGGAVGDALGYAVDTIINEIRYEPLVLLYYR